MAEKETKKDPNPTHHQLAFSLHSKSSGPRKYGSYQAEIYGKGILHGILPSVTTDPNKLEAKAKEVLSIRSFNYVAGGAGEKATMDANRLAFRQWKA
jgi:hypothetical protein